MSRCFYHGARQLGVLLILKQLYGRRRCRHGRRQITVVVVDGQRCPSIVDGGSAVRGLQWIGSERRHVFLKRRFKCVEVVGCWCVGLFPDVRFHNAGNREGQRVGRLGTVLFPETVTVPVIADRRHRIHGGVCR